MTLVTVLSTLDNPSKLPTSEGTVCADRSSGIVCTDDVGSMTDADVSSTDFSSKTEVDVSDEDVERDRETLFSEASEETVERTEVAGVGAMELVSVVLSIPMPSVLVPTSGAVSKDRVSSTYMLEVNVETVSEPVTTVKAGASFDDMPIASVFVELDFISVSLAIRVESTECKA